MATVSPHGTHCRMRRQGDRPRKGESTHGTPVVSLSPGLEEGRSPSRSCCVTATALQEFEAAQNQGSRVLSREALLTGPAPLEAGQGAKSVASREPLAGNRRRGAVMRPLAFNPRPAFPTPHGNQQQMHPAADQRATHTFTAQTRAGQVPGVCREQAGAGEALIQSVIWMVSSLNVPCRQRCAPIWPCSSVRSDGAMWMLGAGEGFPV